MSEHNRRDDDDDHALEDPRIIASEIDALVAFFQSLSTHARGEYGVLAELDRRWGEDVEAEHRSTQDPALGSDEKTKR